MRLEAPPPTKEKFGFVKRVFRNALFGAIVGLLAGDLMGIGLRKALIAGFFTGAAIRVIDEGLGNPRKKF